MLKITFIIPCHNEQDNVQPLHSSISRLIDSYHTVSPLSGSDSEDITVDLRSYEWEIIFINDGSTDHTHQKLLSMANADSRVRVINLARNFGKENAMLAGLDYTDADAAIIMDADMQEPVEAVPEMVYWWSKGYEDVYGRRVDRGPEPWLRKRLSLAFYRFLDHVTDIDTLPNVGDFRLLDRKAIRAITSLRETQRYSKGLFCWIGFNKKGVDFVKGGRHAGKSSFNFIKLFNMAIDGITGYTTVPLRIASIVGLVVSIFSFVYLIYIFTKTLLWGEPVSGFPTLICFILFLGGLQLLALGIIGEYIGRIFNEVKHRPPYVIESVSNPLTKRDTGADNG